MATWVQIADALQATIAAASELTTIWRDQDANAPALDYVDLALGAISTQWIDWIDERYDAGRPEHEQVVLTVGGLREVVLKLEAWSGAKVETVAEATARATLDRVMTKLRLPAARDALAAVGVTPFDLGTVQWVPPVVSAGFRGRAICDVRCRVPAQALEEYADWIAALRATATVTGNPAGPITLPFRAP